MLSPRFWAGKEGGRDTTVQGGQGDQNVHYGVVGLPAWVSSSEVQWSLRFCGEKKPSLMCLRISEWLCFVCLRLELQYTADRIAILTLLFGSQKACPYIPQPPSTWPPHKLIPNDVGPAWFTAKKAKPPEWSTGYSVLSLTSFWFEFAIVTGWQKKLSCLLLKHWYVWKTL